MSEQSRGGIMDSAQQLPVTNEDNSLIVKVAKILREDISIAYKSEDVSLRQPPIDDDHDNWAGYEKLDQWYYVAYSVIKAIDPVRADDALSDLVGTNLNVGTDRV